MQVVSQIPKSQGQTWCVTNFAFVKASNFPPTGGKWYLSLHPSNHSAALCSYWPRQREFSAFFPPQREALFPAWLSAKFPRSHLSSGAHPAVCLCAPRLAPSSSDDYGVTRSDSRSEREEYLQLLSPTKAQRLLMATCCDSGQKVCTVRVCAHRSTRTRAVCHPLHRVYTKMFDGRTGTDRDVVWCGLWYQYLPIHHTCISIKKTFTICVLISLWPFGGTVTWWGAAYCTAGSYCFD